MGEFGYLYAHNVVIHNTKLQQFIYNILPCISEYSFDRISALPHPKNSATEEALRRCATLPTDLAASITMLLLEDEFGFEAHTTDDLDVVIDDYINEDLMRNRDELAAALAGCLVMPKELTGDIPLPATDTSLPYILVHSMDTLYMHRWMYTGEGGCRVTLQYGFTVFSVTEDQEDLMIKLLDEGMPTVEAVQALNREVKKLKKEKAEAFMAGQQSAYMEHILFEEGGMDDA